MVSYDAATAERLKDSIQMPTHEYASQRASVRLLKWLPGIAVLAIMMAGPAFSAALNVSLNANRSAAVSLQGATLNAGNVYIFAPNETGLRRVVFYLDPPASGAVAFRTENIAPFDFNATAANNNALPFNAATLTTGTHSIRAVFTYASAPSQTLVATFSVAGGTPPTQYSLQMSLNSARTGAVPLAGATLSAAPAYVFVYPSTGASRVDFFLDGAATPTATDASAPFDFQNTATDGTAIAWNPTTVTDGTHSVRAVITSTSGATQSVTGNFTVSTVTNPGPGRCAPVICSQIRVTLPYVLDFNSNAGHLVDGLGVGTGFTYVLPSSRAALYTPENLFVDATTGQLGYRTTAGIPQLTINSQTNMLGIGFAGQAQTARISTRIVAPPNGTGRYEQAGLWFGYDEDNYFKLVYESKASGAAGNIIELLHEVAGRTVRSYSVSVPSAAGSSVSLELIVNPYDQTVSGYNAIGNNDLSQIGAAVSTPAPFFSFDAAGIDPEIGTRSFAGLFATHRLATTPLTYYFDNFSVSSVSTGGGGTGGGGSGGGQPTFVRVPHSVNSPTNMVWGPDNRLYVTELLGRIHALTYDANLNVTQDQVINGLTTLNGNRLTLGIAIDPASTPTDVRLWVASSSSSVSSGALNSGMVTRLSGPNFATVQNVITGLPRAIANHAPNSLHFGPDGRLYIAIGGNTGGGAPTDVPNEFGDRPEQWLSAGIVVADVNAAGFDGTCAPATLYAEAPCSVTNYATGLRNSYDFVFHSNGQMYATDNGLGVVGAFPPSPTPACFGVGDSRAWNNGGDNPGTQPDLLVRVEQGRYYGHPNPARGECVFKTGSYQGVAPLPNYTPPMFSLGDHMSANGITEYKGTSVCGARGSLLIANYSLGQSITQATLSADGLSVLGVRTLVGGLSGPVAVTTNPAGDILVAELNSSTVTALRYSGPPCAN